MTEKLSRRSFLRNLAFTAASGVLAACKLKKAIEADATEFGDVDMDKYEYAIESIRTYTRFYYENRVSHVIKSEWETVLCKTKIE